MLDQRRRRRATINLTLGRGFMIDCRVNALSISQVCSMTHPSLMLFVIAEQVLIP